MTDDVLDCAPPTPPVKHVAASFGVWIQTEHAAAAAAAFRPDSGRHAPPIRLQ